LNNGGLCNIDKTNCKEKKFKAEDWNNNLSVVGRGGEKC
jgi:hypothetical protein